MSQKEHNETTPFRLSREPLIRALEGATKRCGPPCAPAAPDESSEEDAADEPRRRRRAS
jgi:hypothetical protein